MSTTWALTTLTPFLPNVSTRIWLMRIRAEGALPPTQIASTLPLGELRALDRDANGAVYADGNAMLA